MQIEEFNHIVNSIKDKVYRVVFRMLRDHEEARDVAQDVFVKVWNKRDKLVDVDNKEAYCMTIARNLAIDRIRSRKMDTSDISEQYDLEANTANPERIAVAKDQYRTVRAFIDSLPENHKTVLELRDIEGYSYKEISTMTGYSLEKVKVYLHRARMRIKEHFKHVYHE